jgi:hypothetical protein
MIPALAFIVAAYTITRLIQTAIIIDADPRVGSGATAASNVLTVISVVVVLLMA